MCWMIPMSLSWFPCVLLVASINAEWTSWTSWTSCSTTCDGGVTYRRRTCVNEADCVGENVRYESCNGEPCSGASTDFRHEQCANYNSVPYNEVLYNWTARYEPHDACALWCEVIGLDVYAKLNTKVTDGTRCDKTSRDICVEGKCWRVGCDGKLGSPVVLDECGVCGGDGSSCRAVTSSLPDLGEKEEYIWTESNFSQCSVSCGAGDQRTSLVCVARLSGQPVPHTYCDHLKQAPRVRVCYRQNCSFAWMADEWGVCSKPCGNGTRRRQVYCTELWSGASYRSVMDEFCSLPLRPTSRQSCNNVKCPILYDASSELDLNGSQWVNEDHSMSTEAPDTSNLTDSEGDPSVNATGLFPRLELAPVPVYEVGRPDDGSGDEDILIMPSIDVDGIASYRNDKISNEAISTNPRFVPSEWGPCSATCGPGVRRRKVQCKVFSPRFKAVINQPSVVCKGGRPHDTKLCNEGVCRAVRPSADVFTWRFSGYGPCSVSCSEGVRHPMFTCVNIRDYRPVLHEYCGGVAKRSLPTRKCNSGPCPARWHSFDYGACSVTCGNGVRIRPVQCVRGTLGSDQFTILPNAICTLRAPSSSKPCRRADCPSKWEVDAWSECSVTCGDGVRTRERRCKQGQVERSESACDSRTSPRTNETCSLVPCPTVAPRRPSRHIVVDRSTYVQLTPQKKVQVLVGGRGVFLAGTVVSVRCTVKRFSRRNVRWRYNGKYIRPTGRVKARNGVLHIRRSRAKDAGLYTCVARNLTADISIGFHSFEEANDKFRARVDYIGRNSLFMRHLRNRRTRNNIKKWKVFTLPYLLENIGLSNLPLDYMAGNWSACSKSCGGAGLMYRDIQCELVHVDYYLMVDDEYCQENGLTPPIESRDCGYQECPHWEVGPWDECTPKICMRSGVGAITRSLYCVGHDQLFPYHMCNASDTPANQKECPRDDCYATWSATTWSECSRACGGKGVQTRALQCVWITNKQPAGVNCRRLHRPSVSRTCTSPPCSQTVCQDESNYCSLIPMLRLCHLRQYRTECCLSCKFTLLDSKYLKIARKHS